LHVPDIYSTLSELEPGVLLELPLGIRDGFGAEGRLDHEALFHQTDHQRPIAGGFVARLSPRLLSRYTTEPVLSSLLTLSDGRSLSPQNVARDRAAAAARLEEWGVSVVVVRKRDASAELNQYVREVLGVRLIREDAQRELYVFPITRRSQARD
jgi:hypothetical protein